MEPFLFDERYPGDRITIEPRGGFVRISRGVALWCFSTTRPLAYDEQRTFDALVRLEREQAMGIR